jgi:hypothetical protein
VKTKALLYVAIWGVGVLGYFVYRHVTGRTPLTPGLVMVICLGAPALGLISWFRYEWMPAKLREMTNGSERDREQP